MAGKKMLVTFDPAHPDSQLSDFLAPQWNKDGRPFFYGLKSGKEREYGMVVYTGREVSPNDLFAKLVDSGRSVLAVEKLLAELESYLNMIRTFRVGTVVVLRPSDGCPGFCLEETDVEPCPSPRQRP